MKTEFGVRQIFTNLLGVVYRTGNVQFTTDGSSLISPVGNRVTIFDLINDKSTTLPYAHRRKIACTALNPRGNLLISVDEDGKAILVSLPRGLALYHFSFKARVSALRFSPAGTHFAAAVGAVVEIWQVPDLDNLNTEGGLSFAPFIHYRTCNSHSDRLHSIVWSRDSRFFLTASKDLTARIWSLTKEENFSPTTLSGHRESVLGAWFSKDQEHIFTASQDGALFQWSYKSRSTNDAIGDQGPEMLTDSPGQWRITERHFFDRKQAKLNCAAFHAESNLLIAGFTNGNFVLTALPHFDAIHTLSISNNVIDTVAFNMSADWIAFGSAGSGQLLVWDWQSESYILKQQSHFDSITDVAYSPDGQRLITTSDDGKVKVWDAKSGFCVVTFTEHSASVTACAFASRGLVLFTSSLDGSVRAWDLIRYRNFRTFSSPTRAAFSSVTVDPSNEVVCGGSKDFYEVYVWSVQTGQLLDQLRGHEGPITTLAFTPSGRTLISGSWDHSVRLWSVFNRAQASESLLLQADILALAVRPDDQEIAVSTLDGQLTFWSIQEASQNLSIDARRDVSGGRKLSDRRVAANVQGTKSFNSIVYSADGSCIIAGGESKYICIYDVQSGVLLRKIAISFNLSIDGTQEFLNSSATLYNGGSNALVDEHRDLSDVDDRFEEALPAVKLGDPSLRQVDPHIRVTRLAFASTGRAFCAASTEGLLIYTSERTLQFDPIDLDMKTTPLNALKALNQGEWLSALILSLRLNEPSIMQRALEATPIDSISLVVRQLPNTYLLQLMRCVSDGVNSNTRLELYLRWIETLLSYRGTYLKANMASNTPEIRAVQKALTETRKDLSFMADDNAYLLSYLLS